MSLRNRSTHKDVELSAAKTPMAPRTRLFEVTHLPAVTQIIQFIDSQLPFGLKQAEKIALFDLLRETFAGHEQDLELVVKDPDKYFDTLIEKLIQHHANKNGSASDNGLASAALTIVQAKINAAAPGLLTVTGILMAQFGAAAAQPYEYVAGQPAGGKDLCQDSLYQCIQGRLEQLGIWNSSLPQASSEFVCNTTNAAPCVDQQSLGEMAKRAFYAPSALARDCSVVQHVDDARSISLKMTALDPIGCNILKDSAVGAAKKCVDDSLNSGSSQKLGLILGLGIGVPVLAVGLFALWLRQRRKGNEPERVKLVNQ